MAREEVTFNVVARNNQEPERKCYENNVKDGTERPEGFIYESSTYDADASRIYCVGYVESVSEEFDEPYLKRHYTAVAEQGEIVEAEDVNSKRYFIRANTRPTDDMGKLGDICFVFDVV